MSSFIFNQYITYSSDPEYAEKIVSLLIWKPNCVITEKLTIIQTLFELLLEIRTVSEMVLKHLQHGNQLEQVKPQIETTILCVQCRVEYNKNSVTSVRV